MKGTLPDTPQLRRVLEDIYNYPLRQLAADTLNRLLRTGVSATELLARVTELREEGRLSIIGEEVDKEQPKIICSLGLAKMTGGGNP